MAKVTKINHNCKHCKKELHPDTHTYYKCDGCDGIVCADCHKKHNEKDLCKNCHHKETNRFLGMHTNKAIAGGIIGGFLILAVLFTWFSYSVDITGYATFVNNFQENEGADASLELFVMSQCPYGTIAEDLVMPIVEEFGEDLNFKLSFIARETDDGFSSLHGQPEVDENIRQLCIIKDNPDKFFDYLKCFNEDMSDAEAQSKKCATEVSLNNGRIQTCLESDEAAELFAENIKRAEEVGASGSPTFYINDAPYNGPRSASSIKRAICEAIPNAEPCAELEEVGDVNLRIVNDKDCDVCDTTSMVTQLKSIVPGLKIEIIDYDSNEGEELIENFGATAVPLLVFDTSIEGSDGYAQLQQYLVKQGDDYMLRVGGSKYLGRDEEPKNLKLFIMSQCPYGTLAQGTLKEVTEAMPDIDWEIYFIANQQGDGFTSLHGQPEIDEDIRQVCILKYNKDKYLDYADAYREEYQACSGQACIENIDSESLMDDVGLNSAKIMKCANGAEGEKLFIENIALSEELEIGASPTYVLNNNVKGGGYTAEDLKGSICSVNNGMDGCDQVLSQNQVAASGQC